MSLEKYFRIGRDKLFPICRSITGSGITQTLNIIKKNFSKLKIKKLKQEVKFLTGKFLINGKSKMLISKIKMEIS